MKAKNSFLLLFTTILSTTAISVKAQQGNYYTNAQGDRVLNTDATAEITGTPYVFDNWLPGKATTDKGTIYDHLKLKYNAYDDKLIFVHDEKDEPMLFVDDIKSFVLLTPQPVVFANGFPAIDKQNTQTYYQVIATGTTAILLKKNNKIISESKGYSNTTPEKKIEDIISYYTYKDNKIMPFKRSKSAVLEIMADKATQINKYLASNTINFKSDTDLAKLFGYYNTL